MYKLKNSRFEHQQGTIVYEYREYDYGLSEDDCRATGFAHKSVTLNANGDGKFFTVPNHELILEIQK